MRPRLPSLVALSVVIAVTAGAAILSGCDSDDDGGSAEDFCAKVTANVAAIVTPPLTNEDDVDSTLDLYRELAELAPLAIEEEWRDLLVLIETTSTVVPDDPESVQRAIAVAFASERSAVAVRGWILTNCGVDIGPVATIAPQDPAATTTLPLGVPTSIVTVGPPETLAPAVPATTPVVEVPPATTVPG